MSDNQNILLFSVLPRQDNEEENYWDLPFYMIHTYFSGNPDGDWRFYVKDWEHKDKSDPLAGLIIIV